jgi:hypothetical protein
MNKKIFKVKFQYFYDQILKNIKKPSCISPEIGEFFFNWSIETFNQFAKHIMNMVPTKFYISSSSEIEAITMKKDIFEKIMEQYDKTGNKRIDKLELISLIPFIVGNDFEKCLISALNFFCLENENDIITRNELCLYFDSYFRCLHNIAIIDKIDEVYEKTQNNIVKLVDNELDDLVNNIMKDSEEIKIEQVNKYCIVI